MIWEPLLCVFQCLWEVSWLKDSCGQHSCGDIAHYSFVSTMLGAWCMGWKIDWSWYHLLSLIGGTSFFWMLPLFPLSSFSLDGSILTCLCQWLEPSSLFHFHVGDSARLLTSAHYGDCQLGGWMLSMRNVTVYTDIEFVYYAH